MSKLFIIGPLTAGKTFLVKTWLEPYNVHETRPTPTWDKYLLTINSDRKIEIYDFGGGKIGLANKEYNKQANEVQEGYNEVRDDLGDSDISILVVVDLYDETKWRRYSLENAICEEQRVKDNIAYLKNLKLSGNFLVEAARSYLKSIIFFVNKVDLSIFSRQYMKKEIEQKYQFDSYLPDWAQNDDYRHVIIGSVKDGTGIWEILRYV